MNEEQKQLIERITTYNDHRYNLLKASEECQELALVLTQYTLKPDKVNTQEIIDEIGDVAIRLEILKNIFKEQDINDRIDFKLTKFNTYMSNKMYKNI